MPPKDLSNEEVNSALQAWRQGDVVLEIEEFVSLALPQSPEHTDAGQTESDEKWDVAIEPVHGLVVVSQTCDIVRAYKDRRYVELSPLVAVSPEDVREIQLGKRPSYAYLPCVADKHLVADLDRTMTVDKGLLVQWERTQGCANENERIAFGSALARKRNRFAFPDDFCHGIKKFQSRIKDKHKKLSPEGKVLRSLREIRILAKPDWHAEEVELEAFFVLADKREADMRSIRHQLEEWKSLLDLPERYTECWFSLRELDTLSAREYIASQILDLEHLSGPEA